MLFLHTLFFGLKYTWFFLLSAIVALYAYLQTNHFIVDQSTCPTCLGSSMCTKITSGEIQIEMLSHLYSIFKPAVSRNVFYGNDNGSLVVLKRVHQGEIDAVYQRSLHFPGWNKLIECTKSSLNIKQARKCNRMFLDVLKFLSEHSLKSSVLCPTTENVESLFFKLMDSSNFTNFFLKPNFQFLQIWTMLQVNIEPILMEVLSQSEGWPTPKLLGTCGNVFIEQYCGDILTSQFYLPWLSRAHLAVQLLSAAEKFTFNNSKFSFYFTDISPYNVVVNDNGTISFIDLEDVIIVDRTAAVNSPHWNHTHVSESLDGKQFSFSVTDVCGHILSDHNFYGVCQQILKSSDAFGEGLLHSIPRYISNEYPLVSELLDECHMPDNYQNRIEAGRELKTLLQSILTLEEYSWNVSQIT